MTMQEKTTQLSYWLSIVLIALGKFGTWLASLDWNRIAVVIGVLLGIATYITNVYYQRRQAREYRRALELYEQAVMSGKAVTMPPKQ
jgi:predicted negative regulator of RcsB-dependent stress response